MKSMDPNGRSGIFTPAGSRGMRNRITSSFGARTTRPRDAS
jgi:hypothetical protein